MFCFSSDCFASHLAFCDSAIYNSYGLFILIKHLPNWLINLLDQINIFERIQVIKQIKKYFCFTYEVKLPISLIDGAAEASLFWFS